MFKQTFLSEMQNTAVQENTDIYYDVSVALLFRNYLTVPKDILPDCSCIVVFCNVEIIICFIKLTQQGVTTEKASYQNSLHKIKGNAFYRICINITISR